MVKHLYIYIYIYVVELFKILILHTVFSNSSEYTFYYVIINNKKQETDTIEISPEC